MAGVRYSEIAIRKPTLEDYFLKLAAAARPRRGPDRAPGHDQPGRLEEVAS